MRISDWGIERRWKLDEEREANERETLELADTARLALLGPAGMGKTFEARRLSDHERRAGRDVRWCRLAEHSSDSAGLRRRLEELSDGAGFETSIYLDALDEAMIPLQQAQVELRTWLNSTKLAESGAKVCITCRSTVWPKDLRERFKSYHLQELSDADIEAAAERHGIDIGAFRMEVVEIGGDWLARQPLTLKMLLALAAAGESLPRTRVDLFGKAVSELATESEERHEWKTQLPLSMSELIDAAERLACFMVLTGQSTVDLTNDPPRESLRWRDLAGLEAGGPRLDHAVLRAIGSSGLCSSEMPNSFGFLHRQLSEYLAGRRIGRLLSHQARALLSSPEGWRTGVAGPLRGTAAFAACENGDVAQWLADCDPEVIGLSDVQDRELRRHATLSVIERFRRGEMTGAQLYEGAIEFRGLRYEGAEHDLRLLIKGREQESEDVLHLVTRVIEEWHLTSMSDELAELALDGNVPLEVRKSAGYAILRVGSEPARRRLKPLINGVAEDTSEDLKGLALRCNWPQNLTVDELLQALTSPARSSYIGAYEVFLHELGTSEFDIGEDRLQALEWADGALAASIAPSNVHRVAVRILDVVSQNLRDEKEASTLARIVLGRDAGRFATDDLRGLGGFPQESRRLLISALAREAQQDYVMGALGEEIQGLAQVEDFEWILNRATDEELELSERENYLALTRAIPWEQDRRCVSAWRRVMDREPIKSKLRRSIARNPLEWVQIRGERWKWRLLQKMRRTWRRRHSVTAPQPERIVRRVLREARKQPMAFVDLCRTMGVERRGGVGSYTLFLTSTPVWRDASPSLRRKVVSAAKAYAVQADIAERCREIPLNKILPGMAAIWLLIEVEPEWLEQQPSSWWERWCWFMLRELHPRLTGASEERTEELVRMLHHRAPGCVRQELCRLSQEELERADDLLDSLLEAFASVADPELDEALSWTLQQRKVSVAQVQTVARFILVRQPETAVGIVHGLLEKLGPDEDATWLVGLAVAGLLEQPVALWRDIASFARSDEAVGRRVIEGAVRILSWPHERRGGWPVNRLSAKAQGELLELFFRLYPPETDPIWEGARSIGPDDEARHWRDSLLAKLRDAGTAEAVGVLENLETRLGERYPWLKRTRSKAERKHRLAHWHPLALEVIAKVLRAGDERLLRSGDDVIEGIVTAVERYERSLRQDGPDAVEDLWNTPHGKRPAPKDEEHVSRKICGVIRVYFERYAVAADREVQIFRRSLPTAVGGEPGSEVDVLVQVPAIGTVAGQAIRVPVEVKLSSNNNVKTAMRDQLVGRYVPQVAAEDAIYVVAWMNAPEEAELRKSHKPRWPDIATARAELEKQAGELQAVNLNVRTVVLDASLR